MNMEKRLFLAIALSMLVLLVWSMLVPKPDIPSKPTQGPSQSVQEAKTMYLDTGLTTKPAQISLYKIKLPNTEIIFNTDQAAIQEVVFNEYQFYRYTLKYGFMLQESGLIFKQEVPSKNHISFVHSDNNKKIIKVFNFDNSNYSIELYISITNISNTNISWNTPIVLGVLDFSGDQNQARFQDITIGLEDKVIHPNSHKDAIFNAVKFLGIRERYFCSIIEPVSGNYGAYIKKINTHTTEIGLLPDNIKILPAQQIESKFRIYLGPQDLKKITSINTTWAQIMHYGTFDFISKILIQLLHFIYMFVHNWGLAIIILSIIIYIILYPLSLRQMRSMKEMQMLQPRIEELKTLYKDNPQKLNKAIMELYKEHKVNPFGGCLPMLLQIPIFFALYQAFLRSITLKGGHFLWIKDLSQPDRVYTLQVNLPILGNEINILPIIMTIIMFIQQKLSSKMSSANMSEQQKIFLIVMPAMFLLIFYHMPSGLVLYWLINSLLMAIFQFRLSSSK